MHSEAIGKETLERDSFSFLDKRVDTEHGLTSRVVSTFEKHWGDKNLPVIHITNDETNWGPGTPVRSTTFVASIKATGLRNFLNVGYIPPSSREQEIFERFSTRPNVDTSHITEEEARRSPNQFLIALDRIRQEFVHHGLRTNKNKINGKLSIPAVVIIDGDIKKQSGDDSPIHAQLNEPVKPEQIIGIFQFDPEQVIKNYMLTGKNPPRSEKSKSRNSIPFREELSSDNQTNKKEFTRQVVSAMATFRLQELKALMDITNEIKIKNQITLAAHELVDIYIVPPAEFDKQFSNPSTEVKLEIENRRKKYSLVKYS